MRYRTIYRICLLAVILITMAGGIFYYVNYVERPAAVTEGTLVEAGFQGMAAAGFIGQHEERRG